jgi:hypothetical protein
LQYNYSLKELRIIDLILMIIPGKPSVMLGRLPEFDNPGRKRQPPVLEPP